MKIIAMLSMLLVTLPVFAGTWVENFDDGKLDGWASNFGWKVQDGKLSGQNVNITTIWMEPNDWKDYTVEASVMLAEKLSKDDMEMSLCIHSIPASMSCYGFCIQFAGGKYATDQIQINNIMNFANVTHIIRKDYKILDNTWYKLKGSITGGLLKFYINNELLLETDVGNPIPASGTVGLYVIGVYVLFDDIIITGDGIPNIGTLSVANVKQYGKLTTMWGCVKYR